MTILPELAARAGAAPITAEGGAGAGRAVSFFAAEAGTTAGFRTGAGLGGTAGFGSVFGGAAGVALTSCAG